MTETRAITFRKIKEICAYKDVLWYPNGKCTALCCYNSTETLCTAANCPVWAKLRRGDDSDR